MSAYETYDGYQNRTRERLQLLGIIGDLERRLESARSIAIDRDQRLAAMEEHLLEAWRETTHGLTMNPKWINQRVWAALQILRGEENA